MQHQEILNHNNLAAFRQHGFSPVSVSGDNHAVGNCIFCSDKKHFYINVTSENKQWDCKKCGESGGYKQFINKIFDFCIDNFNGRIALTVSRNRKIKISTLRKYHVGFNPVTNAIVIPTYDLNEKEIYGLKIFPMMKNGTFAKQRPVTAGGKLGCLGWHNLLKPFSECWILEGEWDYFVWSEINDSLQLNKQNHIFIGLPSANSFKDDYIQYFKGKSVHVLLDNDYEKTENNRNVLGAGVQGMIKIYNKISTIVKNIDFIHWPDNLKDGYDVRDCYIDNDNYEDTFSFILKNLDKYPPRMKIDFNSDNKKQVVNNQQQQEIKKYNGTGIDFKEVYSAFKKWLKLENFELVDVALGCMIGNRFPGDPIWMQLVGPSGCAKSVICMALDCHYDIEAIDTLTPATLISGSTTAGGGDPSLLPKLNNRNLVIKDLTTILEMQVAFRNEIFGIFRSAFDGHYSKPFGNGMITRSGKSKFGFITGVTPAIELYTEGHTALGERFLRFNIFVGDIHQILKQIDHNLEDQFLNNTSMQVELKDVFRRVIDCEYDIQNVDLSDSILEQLRYLSIVIEMMRGTIPYDRFTKEITHRPISALPTRSYVQLRKELSGILLFKKIKTPDSSSIQIMKNIALSTIPLSREHLLYTMYKNGKNEKHKLSEISKILKLPTITCQRTLDKMIALNIVEKVKGTELSQPYKLTDQIIEALEKGGLYK